jgi:hypothetical protein
MRGIPCHTCKHLEGGVEDAAGRFIQICTAFPKGIPEEIMQGRHKHREPFPGDAGIQYRYARPRDRAIRDYMRHSGLTLEQAQRRVGKAELSGKAITLNGITLKFR